MSERRACCPVGFTASPLLKRLEAAGLVERHRNRTDERLLQVSLTDRGRSLRTPAREVPAAIIERLGMSVDELEHLQRVLTELIHHAKDPNVPHATPPEPSPAADSSALPGSTSPGEHLRT